MESRVPRITSIDWHGPAGFSDFRRLRAFNVPDHHVFAASWRSLDLDDVHVASWRTTAVSGVENQRDDRSGAELLFVLDGGARYWLHGRMIDAFLPSVHLVRATEPIRFSVSTSLSMLRVFISSAALPSRLRSATTFSPGPIARSNLSEMLGTFVEQALHPASDRDLQSIVAVIPSLAAATLEEAIGRDGHLDEEDLLTRIKEHIERNLADPDLSPSSIAHAFGVSVRWVHHAFEPEPTTLARYIRNTRTEAVALDLRKFRSTASREEMAARFGFTSRDQLAKSFKSRFGRTISEFEESVRRPERP